MKELRHFAVLSLCFSYEGKCISSFTSEYWNVSSKMANHQWVWTWEYRVKGSRENWKEVPHVHESRRFYVSPDIAPELYTNSVPTQQLTACIRRQVSFFVDIKGSLVDTKKSKERPALLSRKRDIPFSRWSKMNVSSLRLWGWLLFPAVPILHPVTNKKILVHIGLKCQGGMDMWLHKNEII